jgi:DNA-binding MarR family transcriptional regulator
MNGNDAAAILGVTKQYAGRILTELLDGGLVTRTRDPADGRAWLWAATEEGVRAASQFAALETATRTGWLIAVELGPEGKRGVARAVLSELEPDRIYRYVGDVDIVAIARVSDVSPDMIADLRRRLHEAASVKATYVGYAR